MNEKQKEEEKIHRSEKNSRIFGTKKRTKMNTKNKQNFGEIARKVVSRLMLSYEGDTKMRNAKRKEKGKERKLTKKKRLSFKVRSSRTLVKSSCHYCIE